MLAWRLLHEPALADPPAWLRGLLPAAPFFDRDPIALALAALATLLAFAYLASTLTGAGARLRLLLIGAGAVALVAAPTLAFVALGASTSRPYGQDGGVVQLPLALEKILAGESPYRADYSDTILGRQARVSSFWEPLGGNPILRHHAYLPGTHLVMLPGYALGHALLGFFDPRLVTLLFYVAAAALAFRLPDRDDLRLCAVGLAALNPLAWWQQVFGANDIVFVAMILGVVWLARSGRRLGAAALVGLACATKQLAWPFAPFLLVALSPAGSPRELLSVAGMRRLAAPLGLAALVFVVVVAPVAALDPAAFYADIVAYNVGLPGSDNYPLGGTPGFGAANLLIAYGRVASLKDHFPFGVFYALLLPLGLALLLRQLRSPRVETALVLGSAALFASVYFSRVAHSNYLIAVAILLPVGVLALRLPGDLAVTPLALAALAVTVAEQEVFRAAWDQAVAARVPEALPRIVRGLLPHAQAGTTADPIGLVASAGAAGLGVLTLVMGVLGARPALRLALGIVALALCIGIPTLLVGAISARTGVARGLDGWVAQVPADAARIGRFESPYARPFAERPVARDAWSKSFRLEPPAEHAPSRPLVPPGASALAALARPLGLRDPRLMCLMALALLTVVLVRADPDDLALAPGLALLLPFALGAIFGARSLLAAGAAAGAWALAVQGRGRLAALLLGAATAVDHSALVAAPLLALSDPTGHPRSRSVLVAAGAYAVCVLPTIALDPAAAWRAYAARLVEGGPGFGLVNLAHYAGPPSLVLGLAAASSAVVAVGAVRGAIVVRPEQAPALAAALSILALFVAPAPAVGAAALPLTLLVLAALPVTDRSLYSTKGFRTPENLSPESGEAAT